MRTFIIHVETIYRRAKETQRAFMFDSPECINEILRRKLPFFSYKWAEKTHDNTIDQLEAGGEEIPDLTFQDFLNYVSRRNGAKLHDLAIHRKPFMPFSEAMPTQSPPLGNGRNRQMDAETFPEEPSTSSLAPVQPGVIGGVTNGAVGGVTNGVVGGVTNGVVGGVSNRVSY